MAVPSRRQWWVPAGLIALSMVPVLAGAARLTQLADGTATADNARFVELPAPVVIHIVSATVFCLVGAFQFVPSLRGGRRRWHRLSGRALVPFGLAAALSGMWMAVFYALPASDGALLEAFRLGFGSLMVVALVLGVVAITHRDVHSHGAWMMRGYAIGLGAGTQVFTHIPWILLFGKPDGLARAMLMAAGWIINLAVAEYIIRRRPVSTRSAVHTRSTVSSLR